LAKNESASIPVFSFDDFRNFVSPILEEKLIDPETWFVIYPGIKLCKSTSTLFEVNFKSKNGLSGSTF